MKYFVILCAIFTLIGCYKTITYDQASYKCKDILDDIFPDFYLIKFENNNNQPIWVLSKKYKASDHELNENKISLLEIDQYIKTNFIKLDTTLIYDSSRIRGDRRGRVSIHESDGTPIIRNDTLVVDIYKSHDILSNYIRAECIIDN